ncbi:UPF0602 protein C4orf47 homolog [Cephus cinctus]|uniref:Cilia-and flagella-associated protein 96 n=1 Tax=Cephus cinctus TaxID=211228 RepID=A0AAJ7RU22_CEPCN|nr:UPF0602 protein C4orf47 homolog [Cephus cinctus]
MKKRRAVTLQEVGRHFGRIDLDRVGFFDDPPPGPNAEYKKAELFREYVTKGRQLLAGSIGDGLFEKKFMRILEGEALTKPLEESSKIKVNLPRGVLLPPSGGKKHSTPGDWYGCFGTSPTYFSPQLKDTNKKPVGREPPNFKIKPNPLGGPGYTNICLSPYPKYINDPYDVERTASTKAEKPVRFLSASAPLDYFPPNPYTDKNPGPTYIRPARTKSKTIGKGCFYVPFPKDPGGQHAGCFSKFPPYISTPYNVKMKNEDKKVQVQKWMGGAPESRSKYTKSAIEQVTKVSCHINNYTDYVPKVYPLPET